MDRKMFDMAEFYREMPAVINRTVIKDADYGSDKHDCNKPLAMAFVNVQPLESVYTPCEAFCNGTLFPNLNKPFYGGKKR